MAKVNDNEQKTVSPGRETQCLSSGDSTLFTQITQLLLNNNADYVTIGCALRQVKERRLYREHFTSFDDYCLHNLKKTRQRAYQLIQAVEVYEQILQKLGERIVIAWYAEALIRIPEYRRAELWREVLDTAPVGGITSRHIKQVKAHMRAVWSAQDDDPTVKKFINLADDDICLAAYSWSPYTGCLYDCAYCLARELVNQHVETIAHGFAPHVYPDRLNVPRVMPTPADPYGPGGAVLVCPYGDLFGPWVADECINRIISTVRETPAWRFIFQTRFAIRLREFAWPPNAWVGVTVDRQEGVQQAMEAMRNLTIPIRLLFCEPLIEPLVFSSMDMFDILVLGNLQDSSAGIGFNAPLDWVAPLYQSACESGCKVISRSKMLTAPIVIYPQLAGSRETHH